MRAGPKRQRLTIQTCEQMADKYGQMRTTWTDAGTYYASVTFLSGRELVNATQVKADVTHKVEMRYIGPIAPTSRLVLKGRPFNIDSINNVKEINREYVILCHETVAPTVATS
jgi:SPP1 family predicted phage head-tail adaptor